MKKILAVILVVALMAMPMVAMTGCEEEPSDPAVVALQSKVSALESRASTLEGRASTLEGKVTGLGDTSALQTAITSLQVDLGSLGAELVTLQAEVAGLLTGDWADASVVTDLEVNVSGLEGDVSGLNEDIAQIKADIEALGIRLGDLEDLVGTLEPTVEFTPYVTIDKFSSSWMGLTVHGDLREYDVVIVTLYARTNWDEDDEVWVPELLNPDEVSVNYAEIAGIYVLGKVLEDLPGYSYTVLGQSSIPGTHITIISEDPILGNPLPYDHKHATEFNEVVVTLMDYALSEEGAVLVLMVVPEEDKEWSDGYNFEVDFGDLDIDYATVTIGVR